MSSVTVEFPYWDAVAYISNEVEATSMKWKANKPDVAALLQRWCKTLTVRSPWEPDLPLAWAQSCVETFEGKIVKHVPNPPRSSRDEIDE